MSDFSDDNVHVVVKKMIEDKMINVSSKENNQYIIYYIIKNLYINETVCGYMVYVFQLSKKQLGAYRTLMYPLYENNEELSVDEFFNTDFVSLFMMQKDLVIPLKNIDEYEVNIIRKIVTNLPSDKFPVLTQSMN